MGIYRDHLERVRTSVLRRSSMATLAKWITENTFIGGRPYSFRDHEYQEKIASDTSREVNVRKCSQVGVSEVSARLALAMTNVVRPFTAIYCLPTAKFSATFMKTRIDPIIQGSKVLSENAHRTNDNSELKQFGDSFLYVRGAASSNAPISIPADAIISDETDFCDQEVLSQYASRLTHSPWKLMRKFSTPTIPDYGIDRAFRNSRRFFNFCKCNHCNHQFIPDYYKHVRIPGFDESLDTITKSTLGRIPWQQAALHCPRCDRVPSLQVQFREWVCENPGEALIGAGYQVSPFDAPNIITPADLIKASTDYVRKQDFVNFSLGLPMEDRESTLAKDELEPMFVHVMDPAGVVYVMGVDVGNVYHFVIGAIYPDGNAFVVHTEKVPMGRAREKYAEFRMKYRPVATVIDSGPHAETVMALQETDPNLYASVYMRSKSLLTHNVVDREADRDEAVEFVRQVNVNRNRALDGYMEWIRQGHLKIKDSEERDDIIAHHVSMKRIKIFDHDSGEMSFSWQKTDGIDHYHHAFLYMWIASRIRGVSRPLVVLPLFSVHKFRLKQT